MLDMYSRINTIQKSTKVFNGKMESPLGGKPNSEAVVHAKAIGVVLKQIIEAIRVAGSGGSYHRRRC